MQVICRCGQTLCRQRAKWRLRRRKKHFLVLIRAMSLHPFMLIIHQLTGIWLTDFLLDTLNTRTRKASFNKPRRRRDPLNIRTRKGSFVKPQREKRKEKKHGNTRTRKPSFEEPQRKKRNIGIQGENRHTGTQQNGNALEYKQGERSLLKGFYPHEKWRNENGTTLLVIFCCPLKPSTTARRGRRG